MKKGTQFTQRTTSGSYEARHIDGKTLWLVVVRIGEKWIVAFRDFANGTIHRLTSGTNQQEAYKAARNYRDNWSPEGLHLVEHLLQPAERARVVARRRRQGGKRVGGFAGHVRSVGLGLHAGRTLHSPN